MSLKSWNAKLEQKGGTQADREETSWLFILIVLFSLPYSALVWGLSVKHNPQKVGKDHTLEDEDVIQIVKKWNLPLSLSAGPTTAAFPMTKHPTPSSFWLWEPLDQDSGEGVGGTQTGTLIVLTWCHFVCWTIKDLVGQLAMCSSCVIVRICFGMDWMRMGMYSEAAAEGVPGSLNLSVKWIKMWVQHLIWYLLMGNLSNWAWPSVLFSGLSQMIPERRTWCKLTDYSLHG